MLLAIIETLMTAGAIVCFALAWRAAGRKGALPKTVSLLCLSAGVASALSLAQTIVNDEQVLRFIDVFYFASIDLVMFSLYSYAGELLGKCKNGLQSLAAAFGVFVAVDIFLFVLNVFSPLMTTYSLYDYSELGIYGIFVRTGSVLYGFHLVIDYTMTFVAFILFLVKISHTPKVYRGPYITIVVSLVVIFVVNVLYMGNLIASPTDCSIMIYVVGVFDLYWVTFHALRNNRYGQVVKTIAQGSKGPIVCFGDNGALVVMNDPARELFDVKDSDWDPIDIEAFAREFDMPVLVTAHESCSFVWSPEDEGAFTYACDFTVVKDDRGSCLGYGVTMRKTSDAMDGKTGLFNEESFRERREALQKSHAYPVTFTNIGLGYVTAMNEKCGRTRTDVSIGAFARDLKKAWPDAGESFISYRGASDFEVMSTGLETEEIAAALKKLAQDIEWDVPEEINASFEYGIVVADGASYDAFAASRKAHEIASYKLLASPQSSRSIAVDALVRPLIDRGFTTRDRLEATSRLAGRIACEMGLDESAVYRCILLARISDIGKVAVPDDIAFHTGSYTRGARVLMERHVEVGYRIVKSTAGLSSLARPLLCHHEHWDGSGYPDGLSGEEIPVESRVVAVVSAFDELASAEQGLSASMGLSDAAAEIAAGAGTLSLWPSRCRPASASSRGCRAMQRIALSAQGRWSSTTRR